MLKYKGLQVYKCTPAMCQDFATMPTCPGERPFRQDHCDGLRAKFDDGLFYAPRWARVACQGQNYRANGQHSSTMLAHLPDAIFPDSLSVIVDEFECDSVNDLPLLFDQFDGKLGLRTSGDQINAHAALHAELDTVPRSQLQRICSGISCWIHNGQTVKTSDVERSRLIHQYLEFILWAVPLTKKRPFARPGIIGAMLATHCVDAEQAKQFWDMTILESAPLGHPTRVLAKFLYTAMQGNKHGAARSMETSWSTHAYFVKCLHAWNAWKSNASTTLKYVPGCQTPKVRA